MSITNQEINEAVARKLGWMRSPAFGAWIPPQPNENMRAYVDIPDYCHSIEAAWEITECIRQKGWAFHLEIDSDETGKDAEFQWWCEISPGVGNVSEYADTAPMAIAKAFLKLNDPKI